MKPPPFRYHAPATTHEALTMLGETGGKVLAGGQSLIPLLNMRLAEPADIVDINGIAELDRIDVGQGGVTVAAGVRHSTLERHVQAVAACPLLRQGLAHVAHPVVRNRGTVCGSIAHGDPAAELPAVLAVLGGAIRIERAGHAPRQVPAAEFFVAPLETALQPGDLVTSVTFPALPATAGSAFVEVARRHGDYAICGVAATVELNGDGTVEAARTGYLSVTPTPLVLDHSDTCSGRAAVEVSWDEAARRAADAAEPEDDLHATAAYRRHLAAVLTSRALDQAVAAALARGAEADTAATPRNATP